jgi:hypothetical protein
MTRMGIEPMLNTTVTDFTDVGLVFEHGKPPPAYRQRHLGSGCEG